eukprot:1626596-Pleurochrysis_carterae.AAC.1
MRTCCAPPSFDASARAHGTSICESTNSATWSATGWPEHISQRHTTLQAAVALVECMHAGAAGSIKFEKVREDDLARARFNDRHIPPS